MNNLQKKLLWNFVVVFGVTFVFVFAMINLKDAVNKREAMRAFNELGPTVLDYRETNKSLPNEYIVKQMLAKIPGSARISKIEYRAQWISIDSPPETILAYSKHNYRSFVVKSGYAVLRLDGKVEFIDCNTFNTTLAKQQTKIELKDLQLQLNNQKL